MSNDYISRAAVLTLIESKISDEDLERTGETLIDAHTLADEVAMMPSGCDIDSMLEQIEELPRMKPDAAEYALEIVRHGGAPKHYVCLESVDEIVKKRGV